LPHLEATSYIREKPHRRRTIYREYERCKSLTFRALATLKIRFSHQTYRNPDRPIYSEHAGSACSAASFEDKKANEPDGNHPATVITHDMKLQESEATSSSYQRHDSFYLEDVYFMVSWVLKKRRIANSYPFSSTTRSSNSQNSTWETLPYSRSFSKTTQATPLPKKHSFQVTGHRRGHTLVAV